MLGFGRLWQMTKRRVTRWVLAFCVLLFLPALVGGQTWTWTTETVDTDGIGTSLAVDDDGNIHLSYTGGGQLKYAFRPADQLEWFKMPLSYAAEYTKLVLDSKGNAHICATYPNRPLRYAHFNGKKWTIEEIDPRTPGHHGACAVAIDANGTPHLTWYRIFGDYAHTRYAVLQDGAWMTRTLDWDMQTGKWHSMILDSQGNPYVSYDAFVKGLLKCAHWDGKNWKVQVVDSRGSQYNIGMGSSLLLDSQGSVHISYYTESELRYARQQNNTWKVDTVDTVSTSRSAAEQRSSLVFDSKGFLHLSYEDLGALKHAYLNGTRWYTQVIAPNGPVSYRYSAMAIDKKQDILYVSFHDSLDGSLKVAVGREVSVAQHAEVNTKAQEKQ